MAGAVRLFMYMEVTMQEFGLKELYDVVIKTTYPIEINGRKIQEGEVVGYFDSVNISNFQEIRQVTSAKGGWDNRSHVWWDSTKEVQIYFDKGVFSKEQLALMTNAKMIEVSPVTSPVLIHNRETKESDENCLIFLDYIPASRIFVYEKKTGFKIPYTQISESTVQICCPFTDVIIDYSYEYKKEATEMIIGRALTSGYLELQGKTKIKEDEDGLVKTGIIYIPRMKLMSNLSIQLGQNATPVVGTFDAIACPVGGKGSKTVMKLSFLNEDIDSDM